MDNALILVIGFGSVLTILVAFGFLAEKLGWE